MKCPICKGKTEYFKEVYNDGKRRREILVECDMCHGSGEVPMTNDEWRRTCSTEEFADFLFEKACYCSMCGDESQNTEEKIRSCPFGKTACVKSDWEIWLKKPHREE